MLACVCVCRELALEQPERGWCDCCSCIPWFKYPQIMTQVKCIRAMGLERQDTVGGNDVMKRSGLHSYMYVCFYARYA